MANIGYLQITRKCNQECIFCSNPPNENILTLTDAKESVNDFKKKGFDEVILTGGEPTLFDDLPVLIEYCNKIKLSPRIITNGQKLADSEYFDKLINSGLKHIHLSIYSIKEEIQAYLTNNVDSLKNIKITLEKSKKSSITIDINTVINKYNSDHLDKNVEWIIQNYPLIKHFVWNNIDPSMQRVNNHKDVIPKLRDFEISLYKAIKLLLNNNKTFRIERVPLCYMAEFAEYSTETRKIIKNEGRTIHFLDQRGKFHQDEFYYEKSAKCSICFFNEICAGIYEGEKYFSYDEIYPIFMEKEKVINRIKNAK